MRAAGAKLKELYGTQLGQDTIETLLGGVVAAGGQALFTDMTPEEIAIATVLGMGAATVGRPLGGRIGQAVGTRLGNANPSLNEYAQVGLDTLTTKGPKFSQEIFRTKLKPYADLPAAAQYGNLYGRQNGDNIVQALVALGAPLVMGGNEDA